MKSFGVRLAAGAITILVGAYAAALAQKDNKETASDSWSAKAPSLGEPAAPIADISGDSWISQPATEMSAQSSLNSGGDYENAQADDTESKVQLVQHTESAEEPTVAELPQTGFDPELSTADGNPNPEFDAAPGDVPPVDWALPDDTTESPANDAGESMALPTADLGAASTAPAEVEPSLNQLPELEINAGPAIELNAGQADFAPPVSAPAAATLGSPRDTGPANSLRDDSDANLLRNETAPLSTSTDTGSYAPAAGGFPAAPPQPAPTAAPQAVEPARPDRVYGSQSQDLVQPIQASPATAQASPMYPQAGLSQPTAAVAIDPNATIDAPGDRRLEGVQSPSVVIQKRAPAEVKVGTPATFVIHVQNVGSVEALDVEVHDKVPAGMRLIDASPTPVQQAGALRWQLGAMPAGDERTVTMQLVPLQEGELGSVARVSFEAAASVRTISTRPELKIEQRAPDTVLIGQQLEIELEVSNPGTGRATGVVLQEDVPEGLEHPKGRQLDNAIGDLEPGEVRRQVLRMRAVAPGVVQNTIRLTGDDGLTTEHTVAVQVVAPELQVELEGPSRRFLERQATYHVHLGNVGTADATNVELSVQLDRGFTFVSTGNQGQYDPTRHTVQWSLAQLPAGGTGKVPLTLLPVEEGEQAITLDARADLGAVAKNERRLSVEGFAELSFSISNPGGPIELGTETTYEIKVNNSGSKADSNVRVQLQLPPGLELVSSDGDAGTDGQGLVAFQPRSNLSPGSELAYRVRVRGVAPGTHIVKAVVVSDQSTTPVTKEESTVVYADQ